MPSVGYNLAFYIVGSIVFIIAALILRFLAIAPRRGTRRYDTIETPFKTQF